jgi:hypothetical protein
MLPARITQDGALKGRRYNPCTRRGTCFSTKPSVLLQSLDAQPLEEVYTGLERNQVLSRIGLESLRFCGQAAPILQ